MDLYFKQNLLPLINNIEIIKDNDEIWTQYNIKALSNYEISKLYRYFSAHYREVYPNIKKINNSFIGHLQVK